jgi:hypothetical protein
MTIFSQRKKLIVSKNDTKNPKNLHDFAEIKQSDSENIQKKPEIDQNIQSEIEEKPVRPAFLNNLPRLSVPKIYVERPFMRRVVFLSLFLFIFPVVVCIILALSLILGSYWLIKVLIG